MLRLGSIVWGVRDVARTIQFWCEALNYRPLRDPSDDWAIEVERLIGLGAERVGWRYPEGADYIVLADPDGNRFCVVRNLDFCAGA